MKDFNWNSMRHTAEGRMSEEQSKKPFDERIVMYDKYITTNPAPLDFVQALFGFASEKGRRIDQLTELDFSDFVEKHQKIADDTCNTDDPACIAAYARTLH